MRAHGLTNFPDPSASGGLQIGGPGSNLNPESPTFQAAQKAGNKNGPSLGGAPHMSEAQRQRALKFAQCVRAHGDPEFPDPSLSPPKGARAVIVLRGMVFGFSSGFDPQAPGFRQAASACGVQLPTPGQGGKVSLAP